MEKQIYYLDVFTCESGKGNMIGIIYNPDTPLRDEEYMQMAAANRLSEVAVVLPGSSGDAWDYQLRFFAPREEVALCGHGTIGSLAFLYQHAYCPLTHADLLLQTGAGLIRGGRQEAGLYYMEQNLPEFYPVQVDVEEVAAILQISPDDFCNHVTALPLQMVSTGRNKLMVPVRDLKLLLAIEPDFERMEAYCRKLGTHGFHLFTFETVRGITGVHTRHFAPTAGVREDPVTGNANGALGAYLVYYGVFDTGEYTRIYIEQGFVLGRDGTLYVDIEKDKAGTITRVRISGTAVERKR